MVLVFLPGISLQVVGVAVWAFAESSGLGWVVLGATILIAAAASVLKYLHPGRRLKAAGIPNWLMLAATLAAVIGFFAIPVVGAPLAFVLTIYLFERSRRGKTVAWPSTKTALRAIATSVGIELAGAFLILAVFVAGAIAA